MPRPAGTWRRRQALWPLPALLAWAFGWAVFAGLGAAGVPLAGAAIAGIALAALPAVWGGSVWRRLCIALGFPASLVAAGLAGSLPGWAWALPLGALACLYPVGAWRGAPMFPTPAGALRGLGARVPLARGARILDAGCGLGDALVELQREYPAQCLEGIEMSALLRFGAALRCRVAGVRSRLRRGDLWAADWSGFDMVYVFHRPDGMQRIEEKCARELRPGAWLASLEFCVPGRAPTHTLTCADGRLVWIYRFAHAGEPQAAAPTCR